MRNDFCVFILTHGRPDRVITYNTLAKSGYAGPTYLVVDDEDEALEQYKAQYGKIVLVFSKAEASKMFDEADNFEGRRGVVYARNACAVFAEQLGYSYYIQLDDDYHNFGYRSGPSYEPGYWPTSTTLGQLFEALVDYLESAPQVLTIALSQGGDHIGGPPPEPARLRRKAMNSFVCRTSRPVVFHGRMNEDVSAYTMMGREGDLFFTAVAAYLAQKATQQQAGGMSEAYLDSGTYIKSFYSVMMAPSCVQVGLMGEHRTRNYRLHHVIDWDRARPLILHQSTMRDTDG